MTKDRAIVGLKRDKETYLVGETIRFYVVVQGTDGAPVRDARVLVQLIAPPSQVAGNAQARVIARAPLAESPSIPGRYEGSVEAPANPGSFRLVATIDTGGMGVFTAEAWVIIHPPASGARPLGSPADVDDSVRGKAFPSPRAADDDDLLEAALGGGPKRFDEDFTAPAGPLTVGAASENVLASAAAGAPAAAAPLQPAPSEARVLNAGIAGHPPNEPLDVGESYVLEFGVDVKASGDASARIPDASVLFAEDEQWIELTVQVTSDDFDVVQGPTPLKLPRTGPSKGKARFDITPKKKGRGTLTATLHKQGNFLLQMEISYSVGKAGAKPTSTVVHGRTIAAAASLQPRDLGMSIRPAPGGYECTVWGPVYDRVTLPTTETELADAIGEAREALMSVITQRDEAQHLVFQTGLDIDPASQEKALRTLARAGASLFQRVFFGPTARLDVRAVGHLLRKRATRPGQRLTLQIIAERFPIPWGMLYVGEVAGNAALDWDLFLGMRHIIEQIPMQTQLSVEDSVIKSDDPALAVSVNVNTGIDKQMKTDFVGRQLKFWKDSAAAHGVRMQVVERQTRAALLEALRGAAADQLMYLYCHAVTSKPGDAGGINGSHFVFTNDERLTLGELNLEAPMTEPLRGNPLIFINACESAELTPAFYDGFVPYFMAKGARGVVGTECKTPALFATEWALRFFPRFLAGEPLGELFLDLRREFSNDHHNPLGLVYAVYCDGDTQVQPGLTT